MQVGHASDTSGDRVQDARGACKRYRPRRDGCVTIEVESVGATPLLSYHQAHDEEETFTPERSPDFRCRPPGRVGPGPAAGPAADGGAADPRGHARHRQPETLRLCPGARF